MTKRTLPFEDVEDFRVEIVEKGEFLAAAIAPDYPDAERVSGAINAVLETVEDFGLEGKWVTSLSGAELVTTQEIRGITLQAVVDCRKKTYTCFETNPNVWRNVNEVCLQLLAAPDLERYRRLIPGEEDLQNEWAEAVDHPGEYVNLLVGQQDDDEIRAQNDEENHYDEEPHARITKNYYLAYHQVMAHARWIRENPEEGEHHRRFQLWYSQQAAAGDAPGHPLGFDRYREFGPIAVVAEEGGGDEPLPNIGAIGVGGRDAADGSGDESAVSRFSE